MEETIEKQTCCIESISNELSAKDNELNRVKKDNLELTLKVNRLEEMFVDTKMSNQWSDKKSVASRPSHSKEDNLYSQNKELKLKIEEAQSEAKIFREKYEQAQKLNYHQNLKIKDLSANADKN